MSLFEDVSTLFAAAITDGQDNEAIVKAAYEDLLGYADADTMNNSAARIDYWVQKLSSGELTTDNFGGSFLEEANTNQGSLISSTTFENNQTVVAAHEDAYEANPDVTLEDLTAVAAENRVEDVAEEDEGVTGETFTLTTSIDDLTGTADDDTFEQTKDGQLSIDDTLDGGAGSDTLFVRDEGGATGAFTATNIETIDARAAGSTATIELDNVTGYTDLVANALDGQNVTFDQIENSSGLTLAVKNTSVDSDTATFDFVSDALDGDEDSVSLELANNSGDFTVDVDDVDGNDDTIETLNINSSADNSGAVTLAQSARSAESVVVTGKGDLDLTGATLDAADLTVDASDASGDLTLEVADEDVSVTGGSGDDVFDFGSTTINGDDTVDGGAGADQLRIASANAVTAGALSAANAPSVAGIETLFVDTQLASSATLDLANFGVESLTIRTGGSASTGGSGTIDNLGDGGTVTLGGETAGSNLKLKVADASVAGENSNELNLNLADAGNFDIEVPGLEILNIDTANALGGSGNTRNIDITSGDDDVETVKLFGSNNATFDSNIDGASLETVDASALTGALDIDVNGLSQGVSITGGSKADTVRGGGGTDNIQLGAGDDTLEIDASDAQNDTANGGGGSDTITVVNGEASGGEGNNTIDLTDTDASTLGGSDAFDDFSNFQNIDASAEDTSSDDFKLVGNSENNILAAGNGKDILEGGAGDDTLTGDAGVDTMTGGAGEDTFIYNVETEGGLSVVNLSDHNDSNDDFTATAGTTVDRITDFTSGSDQIQIDGDLQTGLNSTNDGTDGTDDKAVALAGNAALDADAATVFIFDSSDSLAGDNFGDVSAVDAVVTAPTASNFANSNEEKIFAIQNNSGDAYGLYFFEDEDGGAATDPISDDDKLSLLGIVETDELAAGDIAFG